MFNGLNISALSIEHFTTKSYSKLLSSKLQFQHKQT